MRHYLNTLLRGYFHGLVLSCLMVVGCASTMPYKYYATSMPDSCYDSGKLLGSGDKTWPDIDLKECKPGAQFKMKCVTMLIDDFYLLKADYLKCHKDLQTCQKTGK